MKDFILSTLFLVITIMSWTAYGTHIEQKRKPGRIFIDVLFAATFMVLTLVFNGNNWYKEGLKDGARKYMKGEVEIEITHTETSDTIFHVPGNVFKK